MVVTVERFVTPVAESLSSLDLDDVRPPAARPWPFGLFSPPPPPVPRSAPQRLRGRRGCGGCDTRHVRGRVSYIVHYYTLCMCKPRWEPEWDTRSLSICDEFADRHRSLWTLIMINAKDLTEAGTDPSVSPRQPHLSIVVEGGPSASPSLCTPMWTRKAYMYACEHTYPHVHATKKHARARSPTPQETLYKRPRCCAEPQCWRTAKPTNAPRTRQFDGTLLQSSVYRCTKNARPAGSRNRDAQIADATPLSRRRSVVCFLSITFGTGQCWGRCISVLVRLS